MSGINPNFRFAVPALDTQATENYRMSIQVSLDGLSFCILDAASNTYLALESYPLQGVHSNVSLCKSLEELIPQMSWYRKSFRSVQILFETPKTTLIPASVYDERKRDQYLRFSHVVNEHEHVVADYLPGLDAYNVYALPYCFSFNMNKMFAGSRVFHYQSAFIECALQCARKTSQVATVYANVRRGSFDILVVRDGKMEFVNAFNYRSKEDFAFFLLYAMDQLSLNPDQVQLVLMGELEKQSKIYEIVFKYVRQVSFVDRGSMAHYHPVFDSMPGHYFYNLLNLNWCEL